ncbi:hypothetical protein SK128_020450, partial [Halocaridina rubra]
SLVLPRDSVPPISGILRLPLPLKQRLLDWRSRSPIVILDLREYPPLRFLTMSYAQKSKVQKVMVLPINLIFRYLQSRARVQVWLYENQNLRIEGHIIGFDEYMNVMLDAAEEVHIKKATRKNIGRILLKGDNITLIQNTQPDGSNM